MESNMITHCSHPEHPLIEASDSQRIYTCDGCKIKGIGQRHRCERCNFNLHPCCLFTSPNMTVQGQKCHFYERPPQGVHCKKAKCRKCRSCDACGMTIMGFVYHCPKTDSDFHPTCVNLETEIRVDDVIFKLQNQGTSNCACCKRKLLKGAVKKIPGWSYVAEGNSDYSLHVYCMMKMAMQSSSSNEISGKSRSKNISRTNKKWLRILKVFIGTVFSTLLGDPTTIIASTMAHLIIEGLYGIEG